MLCHGVTSHPAFVYTCRHDHIMLSPLHILLYSTGMMLPHLMWTQCSQLSHDIALWLLLTDLPHIPHGYCRSCPKCKQKETMNQTLHNGQTGQPTPIINNQVDDMNTSNISTGSNTSISSTRDNHNLLTILTMNCRSLKSEGKRNELNTIIETHQMYCFLLICWKCSCHPPDCLLLVLTGPSGRYVVFGS
jgi:hypothetical protein